MEAMSSRVEQLTAKALGVRGPRGELTIAVLGCFMGTVLLLGAVQFFLDARQILDEREPPRNFFTLNKKIEGGALANLGKNDEGFSIGEINDLLCQVNRHTDTVTEPTSPVASVLDCVEKP